MYTRTYDDNRGILIPESYGGTALYDGVAIQTGKDEEESGAQEAESVLTEGHLDNAKDAQTFSLFSKLHLPDFLTKTFKNSNFGLQKIGIEEILIIGTATFLFFSKDGDRECAIMLLLLLFLG